MVSRIDIKLIDNDLIFQNNDLIIAESDDQHIVDTINAAPGWWKETFQDGVGIMNYLKGRNVEQDLQRSVKLNLQSDGYKSSPRASYDTNGKLTVETNVNL